METVYNLRCGLTVLCVLFVVSCSGESRYRETCNKRLLMKIIKPEGCFGRRIPMVGCHGTCISYTEVSRSNTSEVTRHCACCQNIGPNRIRTARFTCRKRDGSGYHHIFLQISIPSDCECRPCRQGFTGDIGVVASKRSEQAEGNDFEGEILEDEIDLKDLSDIYMNGDEYEPQFADESKVKLEKN